MPNGALWRLKNESQGNRIGRQRLITFSPESWAAQMRYATLHRVKRARIVRDSIITLKHAPCP